MLSHRPVRLLRGLSEAAWGSLGRDRGRRRVGPARQHRALLSSCVMQSLHDLARLVHEHQVAADPEELRLQHVRLLRGGELDARAPVALQRFRGRHHGSREALAQRGHKGRLGGPLSLLRQRVEAAQPLMGRQQNVHVLRSCAHVQHDAVSVSPRSLAHPPADTEVREVRHDEGDLGGVEGHGSRSPV